MIILGSNSFFFESTGRTFNVQPFTSDIGIAKNVTIVYGALSCGCTYSGEVYVLVIKNALQVPSTCHDLIPPFIMRAGGIATNDVPKIHCEDPVVNDYSIYSEHSDLRITLQLNGVFSHFQTIVTTERELKECEKLFLTPGSSDWNPHYQFYKLNY